MPHCPSCSSETPGGARFCAACGAALQDSQTRTHGLPPGQAAAAVRSSDPSSVHGRFLPGTVLGQRYRIVGLLGRGGMGEVYRADDLELGQSVALKFLPQKLADDPAALERFRGEVRLARQIAHPNVCRVYDIAQAGGNVFLSMEYVDGEDLSHVLRRLGRPSREKALEIAQQICRGLAAAHENGVLHRDLKPANVMIDGRGRVRISDFGLAGLADELEASPQHAGTPAYMAPEQLESGKVSVGSDIYALGLVLYELFTGKRAFEGDTLEELRRSRASGSIPSMQSSGDPVDPAIERVILHCLEPDPADRPRSVYAVLAALPGGDPLAAALAAGITPSPEMVAAAGSRGGLARWVAGACVGATLLGALLVAWLYPRLHLVRQVPLDKPPEELAADARELLETLGYGERPLDRAWGFAYDHELLQHVHASVPAVERQRRLTEGRPRPIRFWYRESPGLLQPVFFYRGILVTPEDPPLTGSGMVRMVTDTEGMLSSLEVVPPELDTSEPVTGDVDWRPLFDMAGLRIESFRSASPQWNPEVPCDARAAWEGSYDGAANTPVRVEAGAYRGRPNYFRVVHSWTEPRRVATGLRPNELYGMLVLLVILASAIVVARNNVRTGRWDRRGALRLAAAWFALNLVIFVFGADHVAGLGEFALLFLSIAWGLLTGAMVWLVYVALEPWIRRVWPDSLISWSRLLAGRYRDPLVGRDVLIGAPVGVATVLVVYAAELIPSWLQGVPPVPRALPIASFSDGVLVTLAGVRHAVMLFAYLPQITLSFALASAFLVLLLRAILRWPLPAYVLTVVPLAAMIAVRYPDPDAWTWMSALLSAAMTLTVLVRFGLLATVSVAMFGTWDAVGILTLDLSTWYTGRFLLLAAGYALLLAWAYVTATRTRGDLRAAWQ